MLDYKTQCRTNLKPKMQLCCLVVKKLRKIITTVTGELVFTVDRINPTFLGGMTGSFLCKRWTTVVPPKLSWPQNRPGSELNHTIFTHLLGQCTIFKQFHTSKNVDIAEY